SSHWMGNSMLTADRDFKIRVTVFPKKTLDEAHEIHSCGDQLRSLVDLNLINLSSLLKLSHLG
nr:tRNA (guanine-N(7)-)-methyltransferase non-catalytic subunit wdr4 [Tanacetum cinerariifolium]